jgi:hypothetical protein
MLCRIDQKLIRVNILRHANTSQDHMDKLLDLSSVIASLKSTQVLHKSLIGSNFEAFEILLFKEFESYEILSVQIFLCNHLFIYFVNENSAKWLNQFVLICHLNQLGFFLREKI